MENKKTSLHTFIIAAMTADGYIARDAHHLASWTSKEDKKFFVERTKQAGVMVMGSHTYETIGKPMPGRLTIVYSRSKKYEGVEMTQLEPRALLEDLERRGYKEVAICGGANIYTMFIKAGVVNTLYITVEPVIFGGGIGLFTEKLDVDLKLASSKKLSDNVVLLEYKCL
jgi:dihydrofolate reductase